jgi:hypothetical protein
MIYDTITIGTRFRFLVPRQSDLLFRLPIHNSYILPQDLEHIINAGWPVTLLLYPYTIYLDDGETF